MTIDGIPRARAPAIGGALVGSPVPPPATHAPLYDADEPRDMRPRRPMLLRGALSALRYQTLPSAPAARVSDTPPGVTSTDGQLAKTLEKHFGLLHRFQKDAGLTQSALHQIASAELGESEGLDRAILAAREILKRPRLNDAIIGADGVITRDSLATAATALQGNSAPSVFSQDPFHAQGNAQVVEAFKGLFDQLRDKSKDRTFFFEKYQYVEIAALKSVMKDPDALDRQGLPEREPATGLPKKKYSEHCVYTAKNILERPGLLRSLERAQGPRLFSGLHQPGWLSNKSLDRWLEQDKAHKAR